jgi:hypothetical protein
MERWGVTCRACQQPAFAVIGPKPTATDVVTVDRCQHLDGKPISGSEDMHCDSCGADYAAKGVEPSEKWTLLEIDLSREAEQQRMAFFGTAAATVDIDAVMAAIASTRAPKVSESRPRRRKRVS